MPGHDLILIDASSYLFRAFHALPALSNQGGEPTGALHGVLNMINKLIRETRPERIGVVFDAPGKTFRNELYAAYKANRPPMPDELRAQIEPLLEAIRLMGLPLLRIPGVEADDVIGTLCRQSAASGLSVLVSTSDKDLAQLVSDKVTLVDTMSDTLLDREGVKAKFDVHPEQIVDYLALVGDTADNIPGVPKVGPKTAAKWLNAYDSADGILEHAADIEGKVGDSLREHVATLKLSRTLATIRTDVELDLDPEDLRPAAADIPALRALYAHFELRTLRRQLEDDAHETPETEVSRPAASRYDTVLDWPSFDAWLERIHAATLTAFDTETTSVDYMQAELVGLSLAIEPGEAAYVPLAHDYPGAPEQLPRDAVLDRLKPWLESDAHGKVGHHLKYDAHVLRRYGIELAGMAHDSMLESYVLHSVATRHDMDSVARHYLGRETIRYEDVAGKGAKQLRFNQIDLDAAAPYAAEDAEVTLLLHRELWRRLGREPALKTVYETIEQPLAKVLLDIEAAGVLLDLARLKRHSAELAQSMQTLEQRAYALAGGSFNLGSPKQLQEILFARLELPVIRKTPKGQPSTAEDVLAELAHDYELPRVIMDYRRVAKLKSTYTDRLPEQIDDTTGRVHTSYHQAVTATGRLSSSDPNLQNIPIRNAAGRRIRKAFIAPPGKTILAADYSQIELRIMAHLSADPGLVQAFARDRDIHRATAAEVFAVALDEVSGEQRRSAKAINFGLMYGMSAFGLAKQLGVSRHEAQEYVDLYFDRYPGVKAFMDGVRASARERGYVETVFGRRLYLPEINARNVQRRQYAERSAINAPMQGTAADIIKRAMLSVHDWLRSTSADARIIMQVHDELVLEVADDVLSEVRDGVIERMSAAATLAVALKVDAGTGANWEQAH